MSTKTIEISQAQEQFNHLMALALEGENVVITEQGRPILKLAVVKEDEKSLEDSEPIIQDLGIPVPPTDPMIGLLESFLEEILDSLITIDLELNALREHPRDSKQLQRVYNVFHKVKYNCNIIHARKLERLVTETEDLVVQIQMHQADLKTIPIDILQRSADAFVTIARNLLRDRTEGDIDFNPLIRQIKDTSQRIKEL